MPYLVKAKQFCVVGTCGALPTSYHPIFNFTYASNWQNASGANFVAFSTGFAWAWQTIQSQIFLPFQVTFNFEVEWGTFMGEPDTGNAMSNQPQNAQYTYSQMVNALQATATTTLGKQAANSIPAIDPFVTSPNIFVISNALAKCLGLLAPDYDAQYDGYFGVNDEITWYFGGSGSDYDSHLALNDVTQMMGRQIFAGALDLGSYAYGVGDMFSYSAASTRDVETYNGGVYISPDNGTTNLADYNPAAADYTGIEPTTDIFAVYDTMLGHAYTQSTVDKQIMDMYGFPAAA